MDTRCFDNFTTNRVEGENAVLKAGEMGADSHTSFPRLLQIIQTKDQRRAKKHRAALYRATVSRPMATVALFEQLYPLLPTEVMKALESQYARAGKHVLVAVNTLSARLPPYNVTMRGSAVGHYGVEPRNRTVYYETDQGVKRLTCDCKFWKR